MVRIAACVLEFCHDDDAETACSQRVGAVGGAFDTRLDPHSRSYLCGSCVLGALGFTTCAEGGTPVFSVPPDLWSSDRGTTTTTPPKHGFLPQARPRTEWQLGHLSDFAILGTLASAESQQRLMERVGASKPLTAANAGGLGYVHDCT